MASLLTAGPFSATNAEGRELYADVRLEVEHGRFVLLSGASGSGKSTLLRQVAGLHRAEGARRTLGDTEYGRGELCRWRARVTLLAQDAPMLLGGTIEDNLGFPFRLGPASKPYDAEQARGLLERVGLGELEPTRDASSLSGGERHRLGLVRGLLWDPEVLLADEPLSGVDAECAAQCLALLRAQARRADRSVVCVLHEPGLAAAAEPDLRLILADGRLEPSP